MKKAKQILAIAGIILLLLPYALTFVAAIFDSTKTMQYFSAALAATVLVPVTMWLFLRMADTRKKNKEDE